MDGSKAACTRPKVNNNPAACCEENQRSYDLGHTTSTKVKHRDYLRMTLDCSRKKVLLVNMTDCASQMEEDFPDKLGIITKD